MEPSQDPLSRDRAAYASIMDRISAKDSPVGIDAQYTHAVILTYLQRIEARLEQLERRLLEVGR